LKTLYRPGNTERYRRKQHSVNSQTAVLPRSEKGDKIADEDVEKLFIGACLKLGIGPVDDLSELFQVLFGLGERQEKDKPLRYYA